MSTAVIFDAVNIVFGDKPETALPLMDARTPKMSIHTHARNWHKAFVTKGSCRKG